MTTQITAPSASGGDPNVQHAFRLGWRFAQLYHDPHRASTEVDSGREELPPHLPGFSRLSDGNRTELIIQEIQGDLRALDASLFTAAGSNPVSTFMDNMRGPLDHNAKKRSILETYRFLRIRSGADDPHLGTAMDLGRMLADTVILAGPPAEYQAEFEPYRMQNAYSWLEDLHGSFPVHAADAVKGSLRYWEQWVANNQGVLPAGQHEEVRRNLTLQGERWRRLLAGEILPANLLTAEDYRKAAGESLSRIFRLTVNFVIRFWPAVAIVLGGTGAIIWAIVAFGPSGASAVAAIIATAAGSLGVSWKTVGATLGKVASQAEEPLWAAEVVEAVVLASFIPPLPMKPRVVSSLTRQSTRLGSPELSPAAAGQLGTAESAPAAEVPVP
jgi:hypothetical protein